MIANIIELLQKLDYYGDNECIEIAKGKHELVSSWGDFKNKINRVWQSKSK
jgi:hypothetical protein